MIELESYERELRANYMWERATGEWAAWLQLLKAVRYPICPSFSRSALKPEESPLPRTPNRKSFPVPYFQASLAHHEIRTPLHRIRSLGTTVPTNKDYSPQIPILIPATANSYSSPPQPAYANLLRLGPR